MYQAILDEVERSGYRVLTERARVSTPARLGHVARAVSTRGRTFNRS